MLKKRLTNNSWIIKNQKGLSAIVATLIIILLVLVAVGIVWVVVNNVIQEGAEEIDLGKFTLDLEIKRVQIEDNNVTVVVVKRNPGEGNFIGMNFVFSDGINSEIIRENTVFQELDEKSFRFTLTEISTTNLKTISVVPIFELSSGKESIGNIADSFDVSEEMKAGITGGVVSNFAALGFTGMGVVNYSISSGEEVLPEFRRAIVDPLDVLPGHKQTFTVYVYSPYGIVNVTTRTELDNSTLNLDLEKIDEYAENSETIEIWSANWTVNDVHTTTYRTTFIATDSEANSNSITLTWTDSCQSQLVHGAPESHILTSCNTGANAIAGLDGGDLIIDDSRTLTIDEGATWVFNDGKSITVTGEISMNGGNISKASLYYTDTDGDGYALGTTLALSGDIRAKDASGTDDCYDGNSSAYPGQTSYFTNIRGDYSWDYNCDTYWTKEPFPTNGRCWMCNWEGEGICGLSIEGATGWQASTAPACGDSGTYIIDPGESCDERPIEQEACEEECYMADWESRTQACR